MVNARSQLLTPLTVAFCFGIVYACSLTFVYVEGDDAATVAFHALGRDRAVQLPYSPYHGMLDLLLQLLPAQEQLLRVVMISLTSLAAAGFTMLCLALVFQWLGEYKQERGPLLALAVIVSAPELLYLGLVYGPTLVAGCLVLLAHLTVRHAAAGGPPDGLLSRPKILLTALSIFLFSVGAACRWDIGAYGLVIVADLLLQTTLPRELFRLSKARIVYGINWGLGAALGTFGAIHLTGYGWKELLGAVDLAGKEISRLDLLSLAGTLAAFQTLLTPAFLVLAAIGWLRLARQQGRLAWLVVVGLLPVLPYLLTREPKMVVPALPGLLLCFAKGFTAVWFPNLSRLPLLASRLGFGSLMLVPWLVGLQIHSPHTSYGPGFQTKSSLREPSDVATKLSMKLAAGFAVPTPEGPRPLGGHAAVLLGGGWRSLTRGLDQERRTSIRRAVSMGTPILQVDRDALIVAHLLALGYRTKDPEYRLSPRPLAVRHFVNGSGEPLSTLLLADRWSIFNDEFLQHLQAISPTGQLLVYFGNHSATIRRLLRVAAGALELSGPYSGLLGLKSLRAALTPSLEKPVPRPTAAEDLEFFATPEGSPAGNGSQASPWDLNTALGGQQVPPGSTVWLRGGIYRGAFTSYLKGSSQQPITVRSYPGEWAVIDGNGFQGKHQNVVFTIFGERTRYWGFEVMSSSTRRNYPGKGQAFRQAGVDVQGPHTKLINLVIHDTGEGNGAWKDAINAELYGNIIYNCGSQNTATDVRHGHALYTQNDIGTKIIRDNIMFNQFGWGIHAYPYPLKGLTIEGNILFENGFWSETERHYNNILVSGHAAERITIANNYTYQCTTHRSASAFSDANLCLGCEGKGYKDMVVKDNYFAGGSPVALIGDWQKITMTGNTFVNQRAMLAVSFSKGYRRRGHLWDRNIYLGQGGLFGLNGQALDFGNWQNTTGLDQSSQYLPGRPAGVRVFVRPNQYEPGRAHIVVYNWDQKDRVAVNVDAILGHGDSYEVRNVQNYLGPPVLTGTYEGKPLSLPLEGLLVTRPLGLDHGHPTTGSEFNVFVLQCRAPGPTSDILDTNELLTEGK